MQGLQALDQFKDFVSKIGGLGRYEDTYIVHAAEGETVVPMEVLDQNPVLKKRLFKTMMEMGIEPGRYIVGNELNSKNPVTGQPEFFLKKIVSQIRKALPGDSEKYLGTIVGLATGNPYLGAIAGGVGSGMEGAIGGGLSGYRSPGIQGLGGGSEFFGAKNILGQTKTGPVGIGELFSGPGAKRFFLGQEGESGLVGSGGKFLGMGEEASPQSIIDAKNEQLKTAGLDALTKEESRKLVLNYAGSAEKKAGVSFMDYITMVIGGGALLSLDKPQDAGPEPYEYAMTGESYPGVIYQNPTYAAQGGVMDLQDGGESKGPGTGTSDSIPAMLSDGEFVMTAKAVRGAGGGDRREGARKMYEAMDRLEARA
jgi:hypothetical protein